MQLRNLLRAIEVVDAKEPASPRAEERRKTTTVLVEQISRKIATTLGAKPIIPSGPVLLVDDVVDSGWTLAMASILLRINGSGPVYPFALAKASLRGS
jgi:predicted amidophosphoribosyltransferase